MKLICKKYKWETTQGYGNKERNFFQTDLLKRPALVESIDLYDYLILDSLSDTTIKFDSFDFTINKLVKESGTLSFDINNLKEVSSGRTLSDWFYIYQAEKELYKYILEQWDDNNVIVYRGIIYNDGIKFNNRDNEIISISVKGFESEFKDYYSNIQLSELQYSSSADFDGLIGNTMSERMQYTTLASALSTNFNTNPFFGGCVVMSADNNSTEAFYVMKKGYMYAPCVPGNWIKESFWIRAGYDNFYNEGVNAFQFFSALCNSMGWIWYFKYNPVNTMSYELWITQRSQLFSTIKILDFSKSLNHSINTNENIIKSDFIMIDNGAPEFGNLMNDAYEGWNGLTKILISEFNEYSYYTNPFSVNGFSYIPEFNVKYIADRVYWTDNDYLISLTETTENEYIFNKVDKYGYTRFSVNKDNCLEIPVISNNKYKTCIDLNNVRYGSGGYWNGIRLGENFTLNQYDMQYYGNPGECIVRRTNLSGINKYETYSDYTGTEKFRKNFYKYLRGKTNLIIDVEVNEIITNPAQTIKIINYDYDNTGDSLINNNYFSILELKFNILNNKTRLTLQKL